MILRIKLFAVLWYHIRGGNLLHTRPGWDHFVPIMERDGLFWPLIIGIPCHLLIIPLFFVAECLNGIQWLIVKGVAFIDEWFIPHEKPKRKNSYYD